jgi:hypothetical protein
MLKNYGYDGAYRDENISISVMLENPLLLGLEPTTLVFSVTVKGKKGNMPRLEDFSFYVMDEANRLHNTRSTPYPTATGKQEENVPERQPGGLIVCDFKHDFLFQDLRLAFYYRPYGKLNIIELKH